VTKLFLAGIATLSVLSASACIEQSIAQCELEALRLYPRDSFEWYNNTKRYVVACMKARGYEHHGRDYCTNVARCYTPTNPLEKFLTDQARNREAVVKPPFITDRQLCTSLCQSPQFED